MYKKNVRARGDSLIPDISKQPGKLRDVDKDRMTGSDLYSLGVHILHLYKYPIRLDGIVDLA